MCFLCKAFALAVIRPKARVQDNPTALTSGGFSTSSTPSTTPMALTASVSGGAVSMFTL